MRCSLRRVQLAGIIAAVILLLYLSSLEQHIRGKLLLTRRLSNPVAGSHQLDVASPNDAYEKEELGTQSAVNKLKFSRGYPSAAAAARVSEISCARLFTGDSFEQSRAMGLSQAQPVPPDHRPDAFFAAASCQEVRARLITETLSREEAEFPLAFSVLMFKDFYQVEKLFRAVYRPEHFYCLHVDAKSRPDFSRAASLYANCLDNVIMASPRQEIRWGTYSVLEADLTCMRQLLAMSDKWRYFINLTGQEFPLRTMRELVRILRSLNGANNLENAGPRAKLAPVTVQLPDGSSGTIRWYKGSVHITVSRGFVQFAVSEAGREISDRLRNFNPLVIPDETFFATLNHNADVLPVPGADKTHLLTDNVRQPFFNRYKNWMFGVFGYPCLSHKVVRQICIWGIQDLPAMNRRFEFFVNKFYYNYQRFALQCMEERFWNHTMADYGVPGFTKLYESPLSFYTKFQFVRNHV